MDDSVLDDELDAELAEILSKYGNDGGDNTKDKPDAAPMEIANAAIPPPPPDRPAPFPTIITHAQWIHGAMYTNKKGKVVHRPPTITSSCGAAHPLASVIAQLVSCFCSNTLTTLTNTTNGFCAQVRLSYHEPNVKFEACCKSEDCVHMSVSIHRCPQGGKFCKNIDAHVHVPVVELNAEQAQEYRTVMNRMRELLNPTNAAPMRGQMALQTPPKQSTSSSSSSSSEH